MISPQFSFRFLGDERPEIQWLAWSGFIWFIVLGPLRWLEQRFGALPGKFGFDWTRLDDQVGGYAIVHWLTWLAEVALSLTAVGLFVKGLVEAF